MGSPPPLTSPNIPGPPHKRLTLSALIYGGNVRAVLPVLIGSRATNSVIDQQLVITNGLIPLQKDTPVIARTIDGSEITSGRITHEVDLQVDVADH
ncbi:hypothetical protein V1512DRAFT_250290, partial [Lipomyces arxii]|uniref:uncharacterized protein n=1 Tax=Lipomyces arxii TaxID=56418 RepID=UPI0034CD1ED6